MAWTQTYDPLHSWVLSTLVAALPILVLFGLLAGLRLKPHWCAIAAAATAVLVAVTVFGMPLRLAGMSFVYGVGFGVVKIAWIVLAAVYLYDVSVHTGQFEIMKESVAAITADRRLQLLMVAFCFGAFIEGAAGFGAPVAIAGAFMIGLGFKPFHAAALNLLANTSPVAPGARRHTPGQIIKAWMPFAILSVFVLVWGLPSVKGAMNRATTPVWDVPYLHLAVTRAAPVVTKLTPEAARYDFNWLSATGTGCFFAAIVAGLLLGVGPVQLAKIFWSTLKRMKLAVIAISFMLGLGFTTRYSGLDAVLGLAFTRTGWLFPFFGTYLGWLGVALTGSDTSSNALFGSLQRITAQQLNLDPVLMCAANSAGGVMGKMVDAQSICVATSATNQVGNEGTIFRWVFWHSVVLGAVVGVIVLLYAYVFPGAVPHGLTIVK